MSDSVRSPRLGLVITHRYRAVVIQGQGQYTVNKGGMGDNPQVQGSGNTRVIQE